MEKSLYSVIRLPVSHLLNATIKCQASAEIYVPCFVYLLFQVVDHITLLVEDWFLGVRPRILVVPCPHCSRGLPPGNIPLLRSFSVNPQLRPPSNAIIGTVSCWHVHVWCKSLRMMSFLSELIIPCTCITVINNVVCMLDNNANLCWRIPAFVLWAML